MRARLLVLPMFVACLLSAATARADVISAWFEGVGVYLPNASSSAPSFPISASNSARATIAGNSQALTVPMGFFGLRGGADIVYKDLLVPFFDLGVYGALGTYSDVLASVDGSIFRFHPAGSVLVDANFFGIGFRFKKRRWMFEGTLKPGFALLSTGADVADGKSFSGIDMPVSASFTFRASLSVCRRIDPTQRVCATVAPNIWEWGWGNGGALSLRWEFGI